MPKRLVFATALVLLLAPSVSFAQIHEVGRTSSIERNTITFNIGYFGLKGAESRADGDVLVGDLFGARRLLFEVDNLNSVAYGAEYLFAPARMIEFGVGLGYSQKGTTSVYADFAQGASDAASHGVKEFRKVFTACSVCDPADFRRDLTLRQIPMSLTGRYLILPRGATVEPYVGGGLIAIAYDYSEAGVLDDVSGRFAPGVYETDGTAVGPVLLAGARATTQGLAIGGEFRWQTVVADVPEETGLRGTRLDLGGWQFNFSLGVRF